MGGSRVCVAFHQNHANTRHQHQQRHCYRDSPMMGASGACSLGQPRGARGNLYRGPSTEVGARLLRRHGFPYVVNTAVRSLIIRRGAHQLGARLTQPRQQPMAATSSPPRVRKNACCSKDCVGIREKENPKWFAEHRQRFRSLDNRKVEDHEGMGSGRRHSDQLFDAARAFLHDHINIRNLCVRSGVTVIGNNLAYKRTLRNGVEGVSIMDPFRKRGAGDVEVLPAEEVQHHPCCERSPKCLAKVNVAVVEAHRIAYVLSQTLTPPFPFRVCVVSSPKLATRRIY